IFDFYILIFSLGKAFKIYASLLFDKSTTVIFEDKN
ncbi:DUF2922 domain-containing protein, partial [Staphylococcus epidermidis]